MGDVVGMFAFAEIANVKGCPGTLCLRLGGAAPGVGESHFVSPSDCFERSRRDGASDARDGVSTDEREDVSVQSVAKWRRLEAEWIAGDNSGVARRVPGCPVCLSLGGVGWRSFVWYGARISTSGRRQAVVDCGPSGKRSSTTTETSGAFRSGAWAPVVRRWIVWGSARSLHWRVGRRLRAPRPLGRSCRCTRPSRCPKLRYCLVPTPLRRRLRVRMYTQIR